MDSKMPPLSIIIHGPHPTQNFLVRLVEIWNNSLWDPSPIPFEIPLDIILNIQNTFYPNLRITSDRPLRILNGIDSFSCISTYSHISKNRKTSTNEGPSFRWIWNLKILNKIKFFIWLMHHNKLPTKSTLHHRGIDINHNCPICGHNSESQQHIFVKYENIISFWLKLIQNSNDSHQLSLIIFSTDNRNDTWKKLKVS